MVGFADWHQRALQFYSENIYNFLDVRVLTERTVICRR